MLGAEEAAALRPLGPHGAIETTDHGLGPGTLLPVSAKRVRPGKQGLRYDVRDLDRWIDSLAPGEDSHTDTDLLDRLGDDQGPRSRR